MLDKENRLKIRFNNETYNFRYVSDWGKLVVEEGEIATGTITRFYRASDSENGKRLVRLFIESLNC